MSIKTNWLSPPRSIKGQDQLGSQAPCEMTYSQLLPGITNVTERARYFSFYTWVAWSFEHRLKSLGTDEYLEYYRRADCLFTLIAAYDAAELGRVRPAERMVGRLKLVPALNRLKEEGSLQLSDYATQEDNGRRYFQNAMGGLGQYYAGPLMELGLCMRSSSGPWIQYSKVSGAHLAETLEKGLPSTDFWKSVERDVITTDTLVKLQDFAPRRLKIGSPEHQRLLDIMLGKQDAHTSDFEASSAERRKSLGLILHLAKETASTADESISEWGFRPAVYAKSLPGGVPWNVPASLRETQTMWAIYERNDLLSIACQTIFSTCLVTLESEAGEGRSYDSVETFAAHYAGFTEMTAALAALEALTFGALVERVRDSGPTIADVEDPQHEFQLEIQLHDGWNQEDDPPQSFVARALQLLATLAAREELFPTGYGNLAIGPTNLGAYPINLGTFRAQTSRWNAMNLSAVVADLIAWVMNTHLSVALRKLSQTRTSSFHLRPTEYGLQVVGGIPGPARTLPRLTQAIRILEDLGALEEVGDDFLVKLSPLGGELLEGILA
jgi:hypothetical protein